MTDQTSRRSHPLLADVHADHVALIVEDDPAFGAMLSECLRQAGYLPVQQQRGQDAIAACALQPALVTLDIVLPDMDGWRVLREIKSLPFMQTVPVLVIAMPSEARSALACGPTAFLRKPAPRADLIDAIDRLAIHADGPTRVLQVDNDPLISELLGVILPSSRFTVLSTGDVQHAAAWLTANLPDIILLDLVMPEVNGFEFLQAVRADPRTRHLPVLVLTAKHLKPQEEIDLSQAAQVVISKETFTPEQLAAELHRLQRAQTVIQATRLAAEPPADTPDVDMSQFRQDFLVEAQDYLSVLDAFLGQEIGSPDNAAFEPVALAAHTLRGSAALMGYHELSRLAGRVESLLGRNGDEPAKLDSTGLEILRSLHANMQAAIASI